MDDKIDILRGINALLAMVAFTWLVLRSWMRRNEYPAPVLLFLHVLGFYILGTFELSLELLGRDAEPGFWSVIFLVGNIAVLIALVLTQEKRAMILHPEKMRSQAANPPKN